MLETEIKRLTAAVEALTAVMAAQQDQGKSPSLRVVPDSAPPEDVKQEPAAVAAAEQDTSSTPSPVTRDELKDMCLTIVRSDKANKPKVAAAIGSFGEGVKLLKDVPDEKLTELKTKLEAI